MGMRRGMRQGKLLKKFPLEPLKTFWETGIVTDGMLAKLLFAFFCLRNAPNRDLSGSCSRLVTTLPPLSRSPSLSEGGFQATTLQNNTVELLDKPKFKAIGYYKTQIPRNGMCFSLFSKGFADEGEGLSHAVA